MQKIQRVITLLGSTSVGKSNLTIRFIHNRFDPEYDPTISKLYQHKLKTNGTDYDLYIYDTAGLERHPKINDQYINSNGFILVYSISDPQSFDIVKDIFESLADELNKKVPIVLVGNKCDLDKEQRLVSYSEGEKLAKKMSALFFETSAFNGTNVEETFTSLLNLIDQPNQFNRNQQQQNTNNINNNQYNTNTNNYINNKNPNLTNSNQQSKIDSVKNKNQNGSCIVC